MTWQQAVITTDPENAPLFETLLEQMGALSITMTDGSDQPIYEPPLDTTPLWQQVLVTGLFEEQHDLSQAKQLLSKGINNSHDWTLQVEQLKEQVWERVWLEHFTPIKFGHEFWVCSTEHQAPDSAKTVMWLDPGLAFGTGTHPTTALCLEWLSHQDLVQKNIIDFGCGSGILAIAALLMGANNAIGIDIDPQALKATIDNATKNQIQQKIQVYDASDYPNTPEDVVIANILAEPLISLAPQIMALVKPDGQLILSGILSTQINQVKQAYQADFDFDDAQIKDDWACLSATKRQQ